MNKDQVIIDRIRANGREELGLVYSRYRQEFVDWMIKSYDFGEEQAKDIYQISILKFYENILNNKLQEMRSTIKTYIFAIGKNIAREQSRSSQQQVNMTIDIAVDEQDFQSDQLKKESQLLIMRGALNELGNPCKALLQHFYYDQSSMEAIARTMNYKNSSVVKNQKYKCLQRLRKHYKNRQTILDE
ncbi:MAG: sigma-70 family RNA polymerase sigma factor [Bacteroidota bacterium]